MTINSFSVYLELSKTSCFRKVQHNFKSIYCFWIVSSVSVVHRLL